MVNAFRSSSTGCGDFVKRIYFDSLNILSGSAKKISLGFIGESQRSNYSNDIYENLCIYITSPNGYPDFDISNNELCETYSAGTVGVKSFNSTDFEIFPNPVSHELNLRSSEGLKKATIINSLGIEVMNIKIDNQLLFQLDVTSLPNGIYFVKLSGNNNVVYTTKFIKN
jgi:hypothetical protein